jgi:hypothetical protein
MRQSIQSFELALLSGEKQLLATMKELSRRTPDGSLQLHCVSEQEHYTGLRDHYLMAVSARLC